MERGLPYMTSASAVVGGAITGGCRARAHCFIPFSPRRRQRGMNIFRSVRGATAHKMVHFARHLHTFVSLQFFSIPFSYHKKGLTGERQPAVRSGEAGGQRAGAVAQKPEMIAALQTDLTYVVLSEMCLANILTRRSILEYT